MLRAAGGKDPRGGAIMLALLREEQGRNEVELRLKLQARGVRGRVGKRGEGVVRIVGDGELGVG